MAMSLMAPRTDVMRVEWILGGYYRRGEAVGL